jgi:hypothetical protein
LARNNDYPSNQITDIGFRLAEIPEPRSLSLAGLGFAALAAWGWRKHRPSA